MNPLLLAVLACAVVIVAFVFYNTGLRAKAPAPKKSTPSSERILNRELSAYAHERALRDQFDSESA